MNYKENRDIKIKINDLNVRMQTLEEIKKETIEKIKETQDSCNHDLIFINGKYWNKACNYIRIGKCLVCGKGIELTPNNMLYNRQVIDEEHILDITDEIEWWNIEDDCSLKKDEIREAERIFNRLTNDADYLYSRDCIKREIIEAVNTIKGNSKTKTIEGGKLNGL